MQQLCILSHLCKLLHFGGTIRMQHYSTLLYVCTAHCGCSMFHASGSCFALSLSLDALAAAASFCSAGVCGQSKGRLVLSINSPCVAYRIGGPALTCLMCNCRTTLLMRSQMSTLCPMRSSSMTSLLESPTHLALEATTQL